VTDKLILGVRGKFIPVFTMSVLNNSGYIYTVPSTQGVYEQQISNGTQHFWTFKYNDNYEPNVVKDITKRAC
jgi:hypothetical protein